MSVNELFSLLYGDWEVPPQSLRQDDGSGATQESCHTKYQEWHIARPLVAAQGGNVGGHEPPQPCHHGAGAQAGVPHLGGKHLGGVKVDQGEGGRGPEFSQAGKDRGENWEVGRHEPGRDAGTAGHQLAQHQDRLPPEPVHRQHRYQVTWQTDRAVRSDLMLNVHLGKAMSYNVTQSKGYQRRQRSQLTVI